MRWLAWGALIALAGAAAGAGWLAPYRYDEQMRLEAGEPPSAKHLLGTDELGRDRWSRLIYGTRVSLALAPAAAVLATGIAAMAGLGAGFARARGARLVDGALTLITDVFLGLPWLFALLAVRAALPLNLGAVASLIATGGLLGLLGWASAARLIRAGTIEAAASAYVLQAEASGIAPWRIAWRYIGTAVRPLVAAQFLAAVPAFLLAEANLSLLGLGVAEPVPSLGNLLTELATLPPLASEPWIGAPAGVLIALVAALQCVVPAQRGAS